MIQLLSIRDKDKNINSYIVCPYCGVKILHVEQIPYLCPMCQTSIPAVIPYLKSLTARLHYYKMTSYIMTGFA